MKSRLPESAHRFCDHRARAGFALPAVLVVAAALLILAVGILLVTGIERNTARSFVDRQRAELAARAGLEEIRGILIKETANDDFVVLSSTFEQPITPTQPPREPAPHLFIARGGLKSDTIEFRYQPLFSTHHAPQPERPTQLTAPKLEPLFNPDKNEHIDFVTHPYQDKVRAAWIPVRDEKNRVVARYAYWVEDLQGKVDPAIAGNGKGPAGTHARGAWPFPAPGLNPADPSPTEPDLNQIALYAVDPDATHVQQGELGKHLLNNRKILISPASTLAAAEIKPPLDRQTATGRLVDPKARSVEESLLTGMLPYDERPLVPYSPGIAPAAAGKPKLNLNKLVADGESAVDEIASFIKQALPDFEKRKGGFPDDYLKTIAANVIDYADEDDQATLSGDYRGLDSYPLVSEFLLKSRWENIRTVGGRKWLDLSVTIYVELWNMTDQPVEGSAEITYETKYGFQIPPNPNPVRLDDLTKATHNLTQRDGYHWFPAFKVELMPNEYRVYKCGTVNFSFDAVSASEFIASPITLRGETYGSSGAGYRMAWNGKMVDQARGGIHRNDSSINYPADTKNNPRQRLRTTIPSHSHSRGSFINNMGDPRMSYYNLSPQDANIYPQNFSPNRRNIRPGTVYTGPTRTNLVYGRVLPSEWPDGGHDSPFGTDSIHSLLGISAGALDDDHRIEPDNPAFRNSPPSLALGREEAPARVSNRGRFLSTTELGRIYDPVMWRVRTDVNNPPGTPWGDVLVSSPASGDYGGGNTLRLGRPEHPAFDKDGYRAASLLDIFHTGKPRSADEKLRNGPLVKIEGHVNINTAPKEALRMLIAGPLGQDPELRRFVDGTHTGGAVKAPATSKVEPPPDFTPLAGRIVEAIIRERPFASPAELASVKEADGTPVFGNPKLIPGFDGASYPILQWTDSAAEEVFARTFEASTVRSRNFRVWIVGQALSPSTTGKAEVLAEVRRSFTVFADPGERDTDGAIQTENLRIKTIHEIDF